MLSKELSRPGLLAAFPVLLTQGLRVRRTTERLPEAADPAGLVGAGADALNVVVVGDSVAAGVGAESHATTIAGRLASRLAGERPAGWTVIARSGAVAADVRELVRGRAELREADLVVVSVGVNETKGLHSDARYRTDLTGLLSDVRAMAPGAVVVLLGIPPMDKFPSLPRALGTLLGARSRRLDRIAREVAGAHGVQHLSLAAGFGSFASPFMRDGFHPSEEVHDAIAEAIRLLPEVDHV